MGVATAFDLVRMRFEMAQPLLISLLSGLRCVPLTGNRVCRNQAENSGIRADPNCDEASKPQFQ